VAERSDDTAFRSATAMESGVALRFPPQSKNSSRLRKTPACSDGSGNRFILFGAQELRKFPFSFLSS
jgi:hypothetical protein